MEITSTQSFDALLEDYVKEVFSRPQPGPPPFKSKFGHVDLSWFECAPGTAHLSASGGTVDDRTLAQRILQGELEAHGFKRATYTFQWDKDDPMTKTAGWPDIEQKAKRLINDGKVQILRNSPTTIVGHVEGDHGTYQTEVSREDPQSQAITMWQCECDWDQFAWQRTRQWKKYEGRPCVLPGALVTMADGSYKPIEDVRVDDEVITHTGKARRVTKTMDRDYIGPIHSIYRSGYPHPVVITSNHEVWSSLTPEKVRKASYNQDPRLLKEKGFRIYDDSYVSDSPQWIDAQDLRIHDWVASNWVGQEDGPTVEKDFALVLGYYLAEGNLAKNPTAQDWQETQWSLHIEEDEYRDELCKALERMGYKPRVYQYESKSALSIRVTSAKLAQQLAMLGGHLACDKRLHSQVLRWSTDLLEIMIQAVHNGDGHLMPDGRLAISTASDHLARQYFDVIVKCGYLPSWTIQKNNGGPQNREGETILNRVVFKRESKERGKGNGRRRIGNRYMSKITKVEEEWYEGSVYNLSVEEDESYVVEGVTTHNCSHVLATYWKAQATPLDEESEPGLGPTTPNPSAPGGAAPVVQGPQAFQPSIAPGQASPGSQAPMPPGLAAPPPELMPQFPGNPALQPAINPVSVPGQKPQTPLNPVQNSGGTFSSVKESETMWHVAPASAREDIEHHGIDYRRSPYPNYAEEEGHAVGNWLYADHPPIEGEHYLPGRQDVWQVDMGGRPEPFQMGSVEDGGYPTLMMTPESIEPQRLKRVATLDRYRYEGSQKTADEAPEFTNGDMVMLKNEDIGTAVGLNPGEQVTIPKNSIGEVLGTDPITGMVNVYYAGPMSERGRLEPHGVTAWHFKGDVIVRPDVRPPGPAIRRRR